jgi:NAD(P)-dependent dehydrogenase (short-subunit alcohol dehydrogenase family)
LPLEGKTDTVTGSSRGFGFEFAKGFAESNCAVFIAVLAVKNEL